MGICDFRGGSSKGESNQVIFETPKAAKHNNEITFKEQELDNRFEIEEAQGRSNENYNCSKQITFNPEYIQEDIAANASEKQEENNGSEVKVNNHNPVNERIINGSSNLEPIEELDYTSLDEVEASVQAVVTNKRKWENCKVEHPLKQNLIGGMKNLLKAQIHAN